MKQKRFLLVILFAIHQNIFAQSTIIGSGYVLPQMTSGQRTTIANPTNGLLVFDSSTQSYWFVENGSWVELTKKGNTANYWQLTGNYGNEIKNTNSGGFWSSYHTAVSGLDGFITAPANGAGTRLMWIPSASAFRVGTVSNNFSDESTWWNASNIGLYSIGIGQNTKASASGAISIGFNSIASNSTSMALGAFSEARGLSSSAIGNAAISEGWRSMAIGSEANTIGNHAVALGYGTYAPALGSVSVGSFNERAGYTDPTSASQFDRIFQVGNGSPNLYSNALTILRNGNVGIGYVNPFYRLQINGGLYTSNNLRVDGEGTLNSLIVGNNSTFSGTVSVGGGSPLAPLHVHSSSIINSASNMAYWFGALYQTGNYIHTTTTGSWATGLLVDYDIVGKRSIVSAITATTSDARIKNIIGLSDNQQDLETLKKIKITNYQYKDVANWGNHPFKKVIAQQIEEVFPQAVRKQTSTIPDIYTLSEKITFDEKEKRLTVTLPQRYDLKVGEKIELVHPTQGKIIVEIESVLDNSFIVKNWQYPADKIFVYGREVDDFRIVDYEAISMLGVSAIQQLSKDNEMLKKEIVDLKKHSETISQLSRRLEILEIQLSKTKTEN